MSNVPSVVKFGRVVGRFVRFGPDSSDIGNEPDEQPMAGTVTLTPMTRFIRFPGTVPPRLAMPDTVTCTLSSSGDLLGPDGVSPGLYLIATDQPDGQPNLVQWSASFAFSGISRQPDPVVFDVPDGGVVDLSAILAVPPAPPQVVVVDPSLVPQAKQAAVDAAQAAAEAAASAQQLQQALASPPPLAGRLAVESSGSLNLEANGVGTNADPMVITAQMVPTSVLDRLTVADTTSLDLTITGAGTNADKAVLKGVVLDAPFKPVSVGAGLTGDGSPAAPIKPSLGLQAGMVTVPITLSNTNTSAAVSYPVAYPAGTRVAVLLTLTTALTSQTVDKSNLFCWVENVSPTGFTATARRVTPAPVNLYWSAVPY